MSTLPAIIRPLTVTDISSAAAIAKASVEYPWSEAVFRDCLKANYHAWLLTLHEPIGFLVVLDQINECQLLNIAVLPKYQRQGYGRQLILQAIAYAKSKNFERITLEVRASNAAAISIYHAMGFIDVGMRKNYYPRQGEREDALLMLYSVR